MITNNLLVLNYEESMSIEAKLKYLQNTFDAIQPEILAAIEKARTLIPTIDGKVTQLFNEWVQSGEFNDVILQELQPLIQQFPGIIQDQQNQLIALNNTNTGQQTATNTLQGNQQALQPTIQQINTVITNVNNTITNLTSEYGNLYAIYLNIKNVYNQIQVDTQSHQNAVEAISQAIGTLYGNITALNNLVNSFLTATDFYTTFNSNLTQTLQEFTTSVPQNATDITNITQLLTEYQTPITNATNELTTITNTYQTEIAAWQAFLASMDSVDNNIIQANNLIDNLNDKINRDEETISNMTTIIANLTSRFPINEPFTPTWYDVTASSIIPNNSFMTGTIGYYHVDVNKFILVMDFTINSQTAGIGANTWIAPLPTPLADALWLGNNPQIIFPVSVPWALQVGLQQVQITPSGLRTVDSIGTNMQNPIFIYENHFFMVGTAD